MITAEVLFKLIWNKKIPSDVRAILVKCLCDIHLNRFPQSKIIFPRHSKSIKEPIRFLSKRKLYYY